ncbi:hypothetical protein J6590_014753 [Homalodisca vitripennis]|nr:hypothetical protein J6590_014753 [Homalodisca vitripennis]
MSAAPSPDSLVPSVLTGPSEELTSRATVPSNTRSPFRVEQSASHSCDSCGRRYRQRYNLLVHQRLECGKEPQFPCNLCAYRAKRKTTLKTHLAIKHSVYGMDICKTAFN